MFECYYMHMKITQRFLRLLPWAGIIGLAIGLRFAMVFSMGTLWADEAFSWHFTQLPFMEMIHLLRLDVHPPFHAVLLWGWQRVMGDSAIAMRLLSFFLSIAGLVTFKLLGKRLLGKRATLLAMLMAAFSPLMIYYAADGRMYALVFFLSSFSALAFWEYTHHDAHKAEHAWFFASLLLVMTHLTGALVVLGQAGYLFTHKEKRKTFWKLFPQFLAMAGLFLIWFIPAALHKIKMLEGEWQFQAGAQSVPAYEAIAHWLWITANPKTLTATAIISALLIVGGIFRHTKRKPFFNLSDKGVFLLWWLLMVLLPFVIVGMTVTPRYLIAAIAPLFLLLSAGYLNIVRRKWHAIIFAASLIIFMTFPGIAALLSSRSYNWDVNVSWIEERYQKDDALVFGWYANKLPFEAVGGFEGSLNNSEKYFFYPFDDDLSWDARYVAHAGTLIVDEEKIDTFLSQATSAKRFFYIPNHFLRLKNGDSAGLIINEWFANHNWLLADHLPSQGRSVGVWLMIKK